MLHHNNYIKHFSHNNIRPSAPIGSNKRTIIESTWRLVDEDCWTLILYMKLSSSVSQCNLRTLTKSSFCESNDTEFIQFSRRTESRTVALLLVHLINLQMPLWSKPLIFCFRSINFCVGNEYGIIDVSSSSKNILCQRKTMIALDVKPCKQRVERYSAQLSPYVIVYNSNSQSSTSGILRQKMYWNIRSSERIKICQYILMISVVIIYSCIRQRNKMSRKSVCNYRLIHNKLLN